MDMCDRPAGGDAHGTGGPDPPVDSAASRRRALIDRIDSSGYDVIPVVNSVPDPGGAPYGPLPEGHRARRRVKRRWRARARRRARQRARHPERFRVDFTDWVTIPWRDRPTEARLADFACATANLIEESAAWHASVLDAHRLRFDPSQESAMIACRAYELYRLRVELGARPGHGTATDRAAADEQGFAGNDVILSDAQNAYDDRYVALEQSRAALVDRAAALDSYRQHLDELAPLLESAATLRRLTGGLSGQQAAALFADAAADELAASETHELADDADAGGAAVREVLTMLARDVDSLG